MKLQRILARGLKAEDFDHTFTAGVVVITGENGEGKTSVQNALALLSHGVVVYAPEKQDPLSESGVKVPRTSAGVMQIARGDRLEVEAWFDPEDETGPLWVRRAWERERSGSVKQRIDLKGPWGETTVGGKSETDNKASVLRWRLGSMVEAWSPRALFQESPDQLRRRLLGLVPRDGMTPDELLPEGCPSWARPHLPDEDPRDWAASARSQTAQRISTIEAQARDLEALIVEFEDAWRGASDPAPIHARLSALRLELEQVAGGGLAGARRKAEEIAERLHALQAERAGLGDPAALRAEAADIAGAATAMRAQRLSAGQEMERLRSEDQRLAAGMVGDAGSASSADVAAAEDALAQAAERVRVAEGSLAQAQGAATARTTERQRACSAEEGVSNQARVRLQSLEREALGLPEDGATEEAVVEAEEAVAEAGRQLGRASTGLEHTRLALAAGASRRAASFAIARGALDQVLAERGERTKSLAELVDASPATKAEAEAASQRLATAGAAVEAARGALAAARGAAEGLSEKMPLTHCPECEVDLRPHFEGARQALALAVQQAEAALLRAEAEQDVASVEALTARDGLRKADLLADEARLGEQEQRIRQEIALLEAAAAEASQEEARAEAARRAAQDAHRSAEARLAEARRARRKSVVVEAMAEARAALEAARARLEEAARAEAQERAALEALAAKVQGARDARAEAERALVRARAGRHNAEIQARRAELAPRIAELVEVLAGASSPEEVAAQEARAQELRTRADRVEWLESQISSLEFDLEIAVAEVDEAPGEGRPKAEIDADIAAAEAELTALGAANERATLLEEKRQALEEKKLEIEELKRWAAVFAAVEGEILRRTKVWLEQALSRTMPGSDVEVSLVDAKNNPTCKITLGGTRLASSLSGGELEVFLSGLVVAIAPRTSRKVWRPILADGFERVSFSRRVPLLASLAQAVAEGDVDQVVVTGCPDFLDLRGVDGVQHIHLGERAPLALVGAEVIEMRRAVGDR